jgi:hypothetical protein
MAGGYRRAVVTFIDILGFKKIVEERSQEEVQAIMECFERSLGRNLNKFITNGSDILAGAKALHTTNFSDSFIRIRYFGNEKEKISNLLGEALAVGAIQLTLFVFYGILIRGGVTEGEIYFDDKKNIVYGPAMVRAYELESQLAIYPRVVLDPKIEWEEPKVINIDFDGMQYIDYLYEIIFEKSISIDDTGMQYYFKIEHAIKEFLLSSKSKNEKVIAKHNWVISHYNYNVKKFSEWCKNNKYDGDPPQPIDYITPPTKDKEKDPLAV